MESAKQSRVSQIRPEYVRSKQIDAKRKMKRRRGLIRRLVAFAVLFTVIIISMGTTLVHQAAAIHTKENQKAALQKKVDQSAKKEAALKHKISLLHNKDYIGQLARKDFLLSKKGEVIFSKPGTDNH